MKTFKKINSKTIKLDNIQYKGYLIGDIPTSFGEIGTHWFNYKGLTYVIKQS